MAEDDVESQYAVPSHLKASGSIGWIPDRAFYVGLAALTLAALPAYLGYQRWGIAGVGLGLIPIMLTMPFGAWWLDPPAEHGLVHWLAFRFARKVLLPQHIASLRDVHIEGGVIVVPGGCRAILAMPTVNLDLASVAARRRHRRQLGALLDGISSHDVQFLVRAETLPQSAAIERMRLHRNPFSRRLADWLAEHHQQKQAIDRRRYLIVPAPDPDTLGERVETISRSFRQAGLEPLRIDDDAELREIVNRWWTWRPHPERLGPERVDRGARHMQSDGTLVRVFALGKLPTTIQTNWWFRLLDGDLACDVSLHLDQQDLALAKWRLDLRYNALASSNPSPSRHIALEQIRALRLAFEGRIRPWRAQILLVVRAADDKGLERSTARLRQQMRDLGAELRLLRWEHYEGMAAAQPLCLGPLPNRPMYLESGSLARTTPLAASTLQMLDGVPWGLAGSTPILLTTANARTGRHFGWFGFTGSGKGFGVRCYLARRHFADRLRVFMWDADEVQHEYADRFTTFLQGIRLEVRSLEHMADVQLDPRWQVVALDVSGMPADQQPAAFARWKRIVEEHVLAFPGESAFLIDEATTLAEARDQSGALALGEAVQTWRKRGIECHIITQRVSDWFGTAIGRKIQGNLAVKWYGAQEDSELYEVARRVNLSDEERDRIGGAGIGQGLLVAFGRRVWADLYDHAAPFEFDAYQTDPPDRVEILPTARVA
jgi:hypothetical protein